MTHHHNRDVDTTYQADASRNSMSFSIEESDMKEYLYQKYKQYKEPNEHLGALAIDDGNGADLTKEEEAAVIVKKKLAAAGDAGDDDDVVRQKKLAATEEDAVLQKKLAYQTEPDAAAIIAKKEAHADAIIAKKLGKHDEPSLAEVIVEQGMIAYKSALNTWDKMNS
jgi:hypothetical protein